MSCKGGFAAAGKSCQVLLDAGRPKRHYWDKERDDTKAAIQTWY
jgi:hypothetical protein